VIDAYLGGSSGDLRDMADELAPVVDELYADGRTPDSTDPDSTDPDGAPS